MTLDSVEITFAKNSLDYKRSQEIQWAALCSGIGRLSTTFTRTVRDAPQLEIENPLDLATVRSVGSWSFPPLTFSLGLFLSVVVRWFVATEASDLIGPAGLREILRCTASKKLGAIFVKLPFDDCLRLGPRGKQRDRL